MSRHRGSSHRRQRGVSLFIALITLAVMALIAAATYRSVDLAGLQSGNIMLTADQNNKADQCVRRALTWMTDPSSGMDIRSNVDLPQFNFRSTEFSPSRLDPRFGLPRDMIAQSSNAWMGAAPDIDAGEGVTVNCTIERVCRLPIDIDASHCQMSTDAEIANTEIKAVAMGRFPLYRITTRVAAPRGGATYSQVVLGVNP